MELDGLTSAVMPLPAVTLTFDLLTPKSNQHIYEPEYIFEQQTGEIPFMGFRDIVCSQGFRTHRLTRGRTHPKQNSSRSEGFG